MSRFLLYFAIIITFVGLLLHYKVDIPVMLSWIGRLPGDLIVRKGNTIFYFPITTAASAALFLTLLFTSFKKKQRD